METLALPRAEELDRRITYHAHSAPLHKVRLLYFLMIFCRLPNIFCSAERSRPPVSDLYGAVQVRDDNMMPKQLLSTFHADNDYHIKDTYNYVTVRVFVTLYL